jgi:hypothetical protein
MSTKTTFKRVALVTVAALGLGVMSVAPSNAAAQLDSIAVSSATSTQVAGETLTATASVLTATLAGQKGVDTLTVTASIVTGPAYVQPILTLKETTTADTTGTGTSAVTITPQQTATVNQATAKFTLHLNAPATAGVYVVKLTPTGGTNAVATTVTITVSAVVVPAISATHSLIRMNTTSCSGSGLWTYNNCVAINEYGLYAVATDTVTATATLASANYATDGLLIASFALTQSNGATNTMASNVPWTVAITSGPGKIQMGNRAVTAKSVTDSVATTGVNGYQTAGEGKSVYFVSDGTTGKSVITFTADGVLIGTRTITVYGAATKLVATAATTNPTNLGVGAGKSATHTVTATDVNAAAATVPSGLTVKSSDTAVATVVIANNSTVTVTGVKAGTATITVTDPATTAAATAATYSVTVKANKPTTAPTITFDKTAYTTGELVTMTVSADMADSATAQLFTSTGIVLSAVVVPSGTAIPTNGLHAIVGGVATYKFYAPAVSGTLSATATGGSEIDLTTLVTAPVVTASVAITNAAADAATVAAEAAEAAAQDATDAALDAITAATEAGALAQEAVDLVTALSAEVTKLMAALKAQIDSLTKLVTKMATTVAKIAAKK